MQKCWENLRLETIPRYFLEIFSKTHYFITAQNKVRSYPAFVKPFLNAWYILSLKRFFMIVLYEIE